MMPTLFGILSSLSKNLKFLAKITLFSFIASVFVFPQCNWELSFTAFFFVKISSAF